MLYIPQGFGDLDIAEHSLHLTLSLNSSHGAALNNLAVLLWRKNNVSQAESLLNSAIAAEDHLYEPHYNRALLAQEVKTLFLSYLNKCVKLNLKFSNKSLNKNFNSLHF